MMMKKWIGKCHNVLNQVWTLFPIVIIDRSSVQIFLELWSINYFRFNNFHDIYSQKIQFHEEEKSNREKHFTRWKLLSHPLDANPHHVFIEQHDSIIMDYISLDWKKFWKKSQEKEGGQGWKFSKFREKKIRIEKFSHQ